MTLYDGDKVFSTILTDDNGYADLPEPQKAGYTFSAWYTDKNLRSPYNNGRLTGETSLYAGWIPNEYTITFDLNGATYPSNIASKSVKSGDALSQIMSNIPTPQLEHYQFGGWTCNEEDVDASETFEYAANVVFRVKWIPQTSEVHYDPNGGFVIDHDGNASFAATQTVDYGFEFVPYTAQKVGYDFDGWYDDDELLERQTWEREDDVFAVAQYTPQSYTILFYNEVDGQYASATVTYDESYDFTEYEHALPGRELVCWQCTTGSETHTIDTDYENAVWTIASDSPEIILNAVYSGLQYTLTLESNGTQTEIPVSYGLEVELPNDPVSVGQTFVGWYLPDDTRILPDSIWQIADDMTATARFVEPSQAIKFSVNYNLETGDGDFSRQGGYTAYGVDSENIKIDSRGFDVKFDGYYFDEDFASGELHNSPFETQLLSAQDIVLDYYFLRDAYTYTIITDQIITYTARWGQTIILETPYMAGHEFDFWSSDAPGFDILQPTGDESVELTMPQSNIIITAHWAEDYKKYEVMLDGHIAFTISYNDVLTPTQRNTLRRGDTSANYFVGWSLDDEIVITNEDINGMVWNIDGGTKNGNGNYTLNLISEWQPIDIEYYVNIYLESENGTYENSDDKLSYQEFGNVGTTIYFDPETIKPDGYVFDPSADNKIHATLGGSQNVLSAYYKRIEYDVTFNVDGHSTTMKVGWGKTVSPPTVSGYIITDWNLEGQHFDGVMPKQDITLTAVCTPKTYSLKFENNYNNFENTEAVYNEAFDFAALVQDNGNNEFFGIVVNGIFISKDELSEKTVWDIDGGTEIDGRYELTVLIVWKAEGT